MTGSLKHMEADYNIIGYGRFNRQEQSLVLINNNDYEITKEISVWRLGTPKEGSMKQLILTTADGFTTEGKEYPIVKGKVRIVLPPTSGIVLKHYKKHGKNFLQFR